MSDRELFNRFNVRRMDRFPSYIMLVDTTGDSWFVKGNTLYHRDNRRRDNKEQFHRQCEVKSFYHALNYIKSHSQKYTSPRVNKREQRLNSLFDLIKN